MWKLLVACLVAGAVVAGAAFVWLGQDFLGGGAGSAGVAARSPLRAAWEPYGYQLREGPRTRSYNLPVVVTVPEGAKPHVRMVLDLQDRSNYYFVEMTDELTRIGKVESGLEAPLGVQKPLGLQPGSNRVVLKRRYDTIEVVLNDAVAARAQDESFHGGSLGAGVMGDLASLKVGTPQQCDPVHLRDDFMRAKEEEGSWRTPAGSWHVAELRNPSLSSNAFYYVAAAADAKTPATAVRGEWFWDNYRFRAAARSTGTADVGVYIYYRDPNNYYLFRWNADKQPDGSPGRKQLVKRRHGQETLLAEAPGGYQAGVWYELGAEAIEDRIRAFIDGHEVFSVSDPNLCFGSVGLYTALSTPAEAHFDDVLVQGMRAFEDDFATVAAARWRPLGGAWSQDSDERGSFCLASAQAPARAVAGSSQWRDYTLAVNLRLPALLAPETEVGLVSHYLDETNYALFAWQPASGAARFEAFVDGQRAAQEHAVVPRAPAATGHRLSVQWRGTVATASLDGQPVVSAWVPGLPRGAVGLHAAEAKDLRFEHVRVDFPLPPEPVLTSHKIFSRELTMEVWAGAANDWEADQETLDGAATQVWWHRADFHGDATMEIDLKDAAAAAAAGKSNVPRAVRLVLSADLGKSASSGYTFVLQWPGGAGSTGAAYKATLLRAGAVAAQRTFSLDSALHRIRFERIGNHIIASANNEPLLAAKDPRPLTGCRAAFAAVNIPIPREDVAVFSDTVQVYTFNKAASDWRPAAGVWEISNRWECDPRWSFFSGVPDKTDLAAIWNKWAFDGDVSVEFAVGPKMETARSGTAYKHTRDFNVTICADGRDLTSGYSFLYGGWDNKETAITRGDKVVARAATVIPRSSSIHRRWFYLKAEKLGNTLNFYVDGSRVLSYTDPTPLPGNRVAIWTWANGIMVARVRISASAIGPAEPPGTPGPPCRSIYGP